MLEIFNTYTISALLWIALSVFLMGTSKGGFPAGNIAIPLLVLLWPDQAESARTAVAFMLPLMCVMDIVGVIFYRKQILWKTILPLVPGTLLGIVVASILFVSDKGSLVSLSDKWMKFAIAVFSMFFVVYKALSAWIFKRLQRKEGDPSFPYSLGMGALAGLTSTIAHQAAPVIQMYYLPQKLPKMNFAGTTTAYFFLTNLTKLIPFALLGRFTTGNLMLGVWMLPVIPLGVGAGYLVVRLMKEKHYIYLIYAVLIVTSALLIRKTFWN